MSKHRDAESVGVKAFKLKADHDQLCCICEHFDGDPETGGIYGMCEHSNKVKRYDDVCDEVLS